uniref:Uncharacterized protein n=1 Tax=Oryza brachyantha TaxID=4533 RepID=J3M839_ORYBR
DRCCIFGSVRASVLLLWLTMECAGASCWSPHPALASSPSYFSAPSLVSSIVD